MGEINPHVKRVLDMLLPGKGIAKYELILAAMTTRPELSFRAVARALGCSRNTVCRVAKKNGIRSSHTN